MPKSLKEVESATLATFQKHRPSEYFSHLSSTEAFLAHDSKIERLYRFGLTFPPEFFNGKTLVDLGSGTGESTVSLARWGAKCTLVEMNAEAVSVAKKVFSEFTNDVNHHEFIVSSLFDIDLNSMQGRFDIAHSRGVFTHVADKPRAFEILAALAKPGGYVIYGDRNTYGGIQEMLQRLAIYKLGGVSDDKIVEVAEKLFSGDIDRSAAAVPRTREAIIFDRWVIQQQDDPTVSEVLDFLEANGLEYVSSWPRIDFMGRGVSTHTDPRNYSALKEGALLVENLWMMQNQGEFENIRSMHGSGFTEYAGRLDIVAGRLRNINLESSLDVAYLRSQFLDMRTVSPSAYRAPNLLDRLKIFFSEVDVFLQSIDEGRALEYIREQIDKFQILFKGFSGVRHVDYLAYKPVKER